MDFESVVDKTLNDYLPKVFLTCPITDKLSKSQCTDCDTSRTYSNKQRNGAYSVLICAFQTVQYLLSVELSFHLLAILAGNRGALSFFPLIVPSQSITTFFANSVTSKT